MARTRYTQTAVDALNALNAPGVPRSRLEAVSQGLDFLEGSAFRSTGGKRSPTGAWALAVGPSSQPLWIYWCSGPGAGDVTILNITSDAPA